MNTERKEVVKAGGWSLANAKRSQNVMVYVLSNPDIHYFVPSAPGAVNDGDTKVTDHLIACCESREKGRSFTDSLNAIYIQFTSIAQDLGYPSIEKHLDTIEEGLIKGENNNWIISRGEAINGKMWADLLGFRFMDPVELIRFKQNGQLNERSYGQIAKRLRGGDRFVIPGFYGLGADGQVRTFPRDGSDVTGSVIARGVSAFLYRNLTSAEGVLSADPTVVVNPKLIETLTFEEYRELGNGGTKVLHRDTIMPVANAGISINVRHSERPESSGTMIVSSRAGRENEDVIGIAGKKGFRSLNIQKYGMNDEIGIEGKVLQVFRKMGISIDHVPSGADFMSVIFDGCQVSNEHELEIIELVKRRIKPTVIEMGRDIGLLSIVGQGIRVNNSSISRRLFEALENVSIQNRGYTRGISGLSITVALDEDQLKNAVIAVHNEFIIASRKPRFLKAGLNA